MSLTAGTAGAAGTAGTAGTASATAGIAIAAAVAEVQATLKKQPCEDVCRSLVSAHRFFYPSALRMQHCDPDMQSLIRSLLALHQPIIVRHGRELSAGDWIGHLQRILPGKLVVERGDTSEEVDTEQFIKFDCSASLPLAWMLKGQPLPDGGLPLVECAVSELRKYCTPGASSDTTLTIMPGHHSGINCVSAITTCDKLTCQAEAHACVYTSPLSLPGTPAGESVIQPTNNTFLGIATHHQHLPCSMVRARGHPVDNMVGRSEPRFCSASR